MLGNLDNNLHCRKGYWFIGNNSLEEVARSYPTPFYLYDTEQIKKRYVDLGGRFPGKNIRIFNAMKANYNPALLALLKDMGASIDAVSPAEVLLAKKCGFQPGEIIFTVNNITDREMIRVQKEGVLFNIGSLSRLAKYGKTFPGSEVCLRFNPGVAAGENEKVRTGGSKTKFGLQPDDLARVLAVSAQYSLKVVGLHKHTGSGIADIEAFCRAAKVLLSVADRGNFPDLRFIDFGGGFKVPYHPGEEPVDYREFGKRITELFSGFCREYGRDLALYLEPGKYLTAESGILILRVNTMKKNNSRLIAGTDSGFTHLIRPAIYNAYHHIINISNPGGKLKTYDVCGNICETGDRFATDRELNEVREGDYLAVLNAGAYCFSMASIYNMRALPAEVILTENKHWLATPALTDEELVAGILSRSC